MPSDFAKNLVRDFVRAYKFEGPVLDVGCADYSYWYNGFFPNMEYKKLDPDPQYRNIVDFHKDLCSLDHSLHRTFGVILILETLEHVENPFCIFKKAFLLLKPGGYLLCTTVACHGIHRHPADYWRFLPDGLELLMSTAGFINKGIKLSQPNTTRSCSICCVGHKKVLSRENKS